MVQDVMFGAYKKHEWQTVISCHQAKDPKRLEIAWKSHEKYMNRLKESLLCSQAPEDATKLTSLLPMMLVMVKVNYLLTTFTSIQLGQLSVFVCSSTEEQVDMVLPLYLRRRNSLR